MSMMNGNYFEPGDIVFFKSNGSIWDFLILMVSKEYTHMGIAISENEFTESVMGGIRKTTYKPEWKADIYRIKGVSDIPWTERKNKLYDVFLKHNGEPYSYSQAIFSGVLRLLGLRHLATKIDDNWFCFEWGMYQIYEALGIRVGNGLPFSDILPDDILNDPLVFKV